MQDQESELLLLIQSIVVEWTAQTNDESGATLRSTLPEFLDLPQKVLDASGHGPDQTADILYHAVLYDELNHYQEPYQQSWTSHRSQVFDVLTYPAVWTRVMPLPPGLRTFLLPGVSRHRNPFRLRMDLSEQDDSLRIEFWNPPLKGPFRHPAFKQREFALHAGEWAQVCFGRARSGGEPQNAGEWAKAGLPGGDPNIYCSVVINVGYVRKFTSSLYRESPPISRSERLLKWSYFQSEL